MDIYVPCQDVSVFAFAYVAAAFASWHWAFKSLEISLTVVLGSVTKDVPQGAEPQCLRAGSPWCYR